MRHTPVENPRIDDSSSSKPPPPIKTRRVPVVGDKRLHRTLHPVVSEVQFSKITRRLCRRAALFDELRDTLRLGANPSPNVTGKGLADIRRQLELLVASLNMRRPARGPARDTRSAIDIILQHVHKHGHNLWGHVVSLPDAAGGGTRLLERTNAIIENFFKDMKHGERRRSGRKNLTQDLEHLPAEAALALNLNHPDYVSIVCGSLDKLPEAFARLDREKCERTLQGLPPCDNDKDTVGPILQAASASLSTADRRVVRTEAMNQQIHAAARSRAQSNHI